MLNALIRTNPMVINFWSFCYVTPAAARDRLVGTGLGSVASVLVLLLRILGRRRSCAPPRSFLSYQAVWATYLERSVAQDFFGVLTVKNGAIAFSVSWMQSYKCSHINVMRLEILPKIYFSYHYFQAVTKKWPHVTCHMSG